MYDFLQFAGCFLLPVGITLFVAVFIGWMGALGCAIIIAAIIVYLLGREGNIQKQLARQEAYERAITTGWTDEERQNLGSTNG
jgi:hypothetical protein